MQLLGIKDPLIRPNPVNGRDAQALTFFFSHKQSAPLTKFWKKSGIHQKLEG